MPGTGYLSSSYGPFSLGADPAQGGFQVRDLALPPGVDESRFNRRRTAMDAVNAHFEAAEKADAIAAMDTFYQQAYSLISSAKAREAFNLDAEPAAIRDEYGRNEAGARLLMARRLIAAGVRVVSVTYGGWDFHARSCPGTRQRGPAVGQGLCRPDPRPGSHGPAGQHDRDALQRIRPHAQAQWRRAAATTGRGSSVSRLAGGGIARGKIFGSSTATAAEPDSEPDRAGRLIRHALSLAGN